MQYAIELYFDKKTEDKLLARIVKVSFPVEEIMTIELAQEEYV